MKRTETTNTCFSGVPLGTAVYLWCLRVNLEDHFYVGVVRRSASLPARCYELLYVAGMADELIF